MDQSSCPHCGRQLGSATTAPTESNGTPTARTLLLKQIGDYRIERLIGQGGTGSVYVAYEESMRRRVALKVLGIGDWADNVARFDREAWIAGRLSHPNIVRVFGHGIAGGNLP